MSSKRSIIQRIKERKLNLFGHIWRIEDNRLVKKVMLGEMEGKTKRGRPRREWLDDEKEWCNEEIIIIHSEKEGTSQIGVGRNS